MTSTSRLGCARIGVEFFEYRRSMLGPLENSDCTKPAEKLIHDGVLSSRSSALLILSLCLGVGCGQSTNQPSSGKNTAGGGGESGAGFSGGPTVMVADNGVSIPVRDPRDSCDGLGLEISACDASGSCDSLGCVCPSETPSASRVACTSYGCVTAISCATFCAVGPSAAVTAFFCESDGLCDSDAACASSQRCLIPPGAKRGSCSTGDLGASCFADGDCASGACVVSDSSGRGSCDGGMLCNRAEQCGRKKCVLAPDHYVGSCTGGAKGSPCLQTTDCTSGLSCTAPVFGSFVSGSLGACTDGFVASPCATSADCQTGFFCVDSQHVCSAGSPGGPCDDNSDCPGEFCSTAPVGSGCTSGEEGVGCSDATQCKTPFCVDFKCSSGAPGKRCVSNSECTGTCAYTVTTCTDGKLGHACDDGAPCEAGLACRLSVCSLP